MIEVSKRARYMATAGSVLLSFTAGFELTVTSTAAPAIVKDLGRVELFSWIFAAYSAAMTLSVPFWGKLADRYGRRICIAVSIIGFAIATAGAGLSTSVPMLIGWRFVEGIFGGAFTALGSIVMADLWPLEKRPKTQALIVVASGTASIVGPAFGAFLVHSLSWRWCFYVTLPGLGIALLLFLLSLPKWTDRKKRPIDYIGIALFAPLLGVLLISLDQIIFLGQHWVWMVAAIALLGGLGFTFFRQENRAHDPLVPLKLFRIPFFTASNVIILLTGISVYGAIAYLPLFGQHVSGFTTAKAAHLLTPLGICWVGLSSLSSFLALRWNFRVTTIIGAVGALVGFAFFLTPGLNESFLWMAIGSVGIGICGAFCLPPLVIGCQSEIPKDQLGVGTSALLFARNIGSSAGVALMGLWIGHAATSGGKSDAVSSSSVTHAFTVGLVVSALMLIAACFVPKHVSQKETPESA